MSEVIIIELDSFRKDRNSSEYVMLTRAKCTYLGEYHEEVGWQNNLERMIRHLHGKNAPISALVEVVRYPPTCQQEEAPKTALKPTLCFKVKTLDEWVNPPKKEIPKGLKAYQQREGVN